MNEYNLELAELPVENKQIVEAPVVERYYYISFSYTKNTVQGFGNIVIRVSIDEKNKAADFIPSLISRHVKKENLLNTVTILSWHELTSDQYNLEMNERLTS